MDQTAFFKLTYGLYIISSEMDGKDAACVVNTLQQVTSSPARLSVAVNKENYTCEAIMKSGLFTGAVLTQDVDMDVIRKFGFGSSRNMDKFDGQPHAHDLNGIPYLTENVAACFSCKVIGKLDAGTHMIFIGDVADCKKLADDAPMTYAYYHKVKNGKTPPKAPSYQEKKEAKGWKCTVCGYIYEEEVLPADYICPICKAPASKFVKI